MKTPDILLAIQPVIKAFEKLSIPYYIGGSIASSVHGLSRATLDVDVVADIKSHHITCLKKYLEKKYYIDEDMMADAVNRTACCNLIHLETTIKIDIFIHKDDPYQNEAFKRKRADTIEESVTSAEFFFASPEDIIINKLQWYQMGDRVSERQWFDVIGVIKIQGDLLDKEFLKKWTKKLNLFDLLKDAFSEAGIKF